MQELTSKIKWYKIIFYVLVGASLPLAFGSITAGIHAAPRYFGLLLLAVPFIAGALVCYTRLDKFKSLALLRGRWAKVDTRQRDFQSISAYYRESRDTRSNSNF
ncbi:MAG: hypothetical protein ACOYBM_07460, partial [Dethiobacteria bacterium]